MDLRGQLIKGVWAGLILLSFCGLPARACDTNGNIEDVPTPTKLASLLPPGGIDALDINFWLIWSSPDDRGDKRDSMYMNWRVEARQGWLYIEHIYGSDYGGRHEGGFHYRKRFKYTPEGSFDSYFAELHLGGGERQDITGKIIHDQLVLKTVHTKRWLVFKPTITERKIPLVTFEDTVPVEWMPLIIAYHIRNGSLGYKVDTLELATGETGLTLVEDMGTELYQYGAQLEIAHFLSIEIGVERGSRRRTETMKLLTARDGNYFQFFYPDSDTSVRRSTIDEVGRIFDVKKVVRDSPDTFSLYAPYRAAQE
ncbi:MAG: hypothetical protein AAF085_05245 [Planctomycetota bacterium]